MNHDFSEQAWDLETNMFPGRRAEPKMVYRCRKCGIVGDLSPKLEWTVDYETCEEVIAARVMEA